MEQGGRPTDPALSATLDARPGGQAEALPEWLGVRYRVKRLLGRGGMGAVYLAVDEALMCDVALKIVTPELAASGSGLEQLRDEVRLAQKVTHRNICRTFDLEEVDGKWLVKMEFLEGETLAKRLERGPLSVGETIAVAEQVCAGLAAAHRQGVVHRDLKPHNIILEDKTGRVALMDFGIARVAALAGKTADNVSGTPEYMAPEQARGREVDGRADLYALGCVLYEMLIGQKLFVRPTPMAMALAHAEDPPPTLPDTLPKRLRQLVARLLEKEPARRPADADEVAAALAEPPRRPRWPLVFGAALAVAAMVLAIVELHPARHWQPQIRELGVYDEDSDAAAFSPDGKSIAYHSDRETPGRNRIYIEAVDGRTPSRAVTPRDIDAIEPRWTRDGKALLFTDWSRGFRMPVEGGRPEVIAEGAFALEDCSGRILIAYKDSPGCPRCNRLTMREADGQERELVRFPADKQMRYPRCDREGRRVLYALSDVMPSSWEYGRSDLWLLPLEGGGPRRITDDHAVNIGTFTPDGRSVIYCATHGNKSNLWERALDGAAEPEQLTSAKGFEYVPDVSPDGKQVIYNIDLSSSQLFEQPLAGGPQRRITASKQIFNFLRPAPDGRSMVLQAYSATLQAQIMSVTLDGGELLTLVDGETPAFTLDGAEILYSVPGRILAMTGRGGAPREVTRVSGKVLDVRVGPDRRIHFMVVGGQGPEAWSAPVAGGSSERELPAPWTEVVPAPRGDWRAVTRVVDAGARRVRLLAPGASLDDPAGHEITSESFAWQPDGLAFIYVSRGTVRRFDVGSGEDRVVYENGQDIAAIAVSADGKNLYTTHNVGRTRREVITNFADRSSLVSPR